MKNAFLILLTFLCFNFAKAQDTLRKVLEYDVRIGDAQTLNVPWLQQYIKTAGNENWLSKLLRELSQGSIKGFENYDGTEPYEKQWFRNGLSGFVDTVYVIDPITYEEEMDIMDVEPWNIKNIEAIRVRSTEIWNNGKGHSLVHQQLAILYRVIDAKGNDRGLWTMFWIYID